MEQGGGISNAAQLYQMGRATIYRWLAQPNLEPIKVKRRQRKLDWEALRQDVLDHPDARLIDRANKFGVKVSSIWYALKEMKITRKKTSQLQRTAARGQNQVLPATETTD
ncbi:MAG: hypothetical protein HC924_00300 [Synechococcaceae cyanobacterium SM2_3_2]|nr:hypothetical protein [Synechococcaceae cyanobacterium SM2_3_2]